MGTYEDLYPYEFHRKYRYPIDAPLTLENVLFRIYLISEESAELYKAFALNDVVQIADALADLRYVVDGSAVTFGFPMNDLLAEVHRSNMTKEYDRHVGKPIKGPNYSKPRIEKVLRESLCGRLVAE